MTEVVSIRFRNRGKVYYFDPAGLQVDAGISVIVETSKGLEFGDCMEGNHLVPDETIVPPLRPVARLATDDDKRIYEINRKREEEAYQICLSKIAAHGLDMKLVDVECSFEGNKIMFFFTSDGRVDFRELVKDLASVFRTRIELRQIGVRDEAKMLGGLGICGRPFCCCTFLDEFQPVSTKMAKAQSMSLNPAKISGTCGRLMCCLRYEQEAYEDLMKHVPKNGAFVQTSEGYGNVVLVNLLRQKVKVRLDSAGEPVFHTYDVDEIVEIPGGRPKPGEEPPDLLVIKPKEPAAEEVKAEERYAWAMPALFGEHPAPGAPQTPPPPTEAPTPIEPKPARRSGRRHRTKGQGQAKPLGKPAESQQVQASAPQKPNAPVKHPGVGRPGPARPAKSGAEKPGPKPPVPPRPAAQGEAAPKKNRPRRRFGRPKPPGQGT